MDDLIVTSISPKYIAQCIQFDTAQGQSQLLCILQGQTSSFRISSDTASNPRIRFIDSAFKEQLQVICADESALRLPKLCALLVNEIQTGRVIIETKHRDGKVVAITSTNLARHTKMSKYANIELAGNKFFKEIAQAFDENLQTILTETATFNKEQNKPETHIQAVNKQLDRKFIAQKDTNWSLPSLFGVIESICNLFKPGISKIIDRMIEDAREQNRLSHEDQVQHRRKDRRRKTQEIQEEAVKRDIALYEKKLEVHKMQQVK